MYSWLFVCTSCSEWGWCVVIEVGGGSVGFFCQAGDRIRDLCLSLGLGDVYKGQGLLFRV